MLSTEIFAEYKILFLTWTQLVSSFDFLATNDAVKKSNVKRMIIKRREFLSLCDRL